MAMDVNHVPLQTAVLRGAKSTKSAHERLLSRVSPYVLGKVILVDGWVGTEGTVVEFTYYLHLDIIPPGVHICPLIYSLNTHLRAIPGLASYCSNFNNTVLCYNLNNIL